MLVVIFFFRLGDWSAWSLLLPRLRDDFPAGNISGGRGGGAPAQHAALRWLALSFSFEIKLYLAPPPDLPESHTSFVSGV